MRVTLKAIAVAVVAMSIVGGGVAGATKLVTGRQIKDGSITGWDIKNHSLKPVDFKGSVRGPRGRPGADGARGPQGSQGVQGPQGPAGPTVVNQLTRVELAGVITPGTVGHVTATCPAGQGVVSGGYYATGNGAVFYEDSFGARGWAVGYDNLAQGMQADLTAIAYCAPAGQASSPRASLTQAATRLEDAVTRQRAVHERASALATPGGRRP